MVANEENLDMKHGHDKDLESWTWYCEKGRTSGQGSMMIDGWR